jgi:hypothetical protein
MFPRHLWLRDATIPQPILFHDLFNEPVIATFERSRQIGEGKQLEFTRSDRTIYDAFE